MDESKLTKSRSRKFKQKLIKRKKVASAPKRKKSYWLKLRKNISRFFVIPTKEGSHQVSLEVALVVVNVISVIYANFLCQLTLAPPF